MLILGVYKISWRQVEWEYIKERETDVSWLKDALTPGTTIGVTDGS